MSKKKKLWWSQKIHHSHYVIPTKIGKGKSLHEIGIVPPVNIYKNRAGDQSSHPCRHEWVCVDCQPLGFRKMPFGASLL